MLFFKHRSKMEEDPKAEAERFRQELEAVGGTLYTLRKANRLKISAAAKALGIPAAKLARMEKGREENIDFILLLNLAKCYKTSLMDLLGDVPDDKFR